MPEIDFKLRPSRWFIGILMVILLGSGLIVVMLTLAIWIKALLFAYLIGYGGWMVWRDGLLRAPSSIISLRYAQSTWQLETKRGWLPASMRGDSTVTSLICILRFNVPLRRFPLSCIVAADSVSPEIYKQLLRTLQLKNPSARRTPGPSSPLT